MDGSTSSVSSMSNGGAGSSRRPKIIGGIIGGAVGLVLLLLCIHCVVLAVRRKHRREQAQHSSEYRDLEKAKQAEGSQDLQGRPNLRPNGSPRAKGSPKNLKSLSVITGRPNGPANDTRPLPQEPQSAPSLLPRALGTGDVAGDMADLAMPRSSRLHAPNSAHMDSPHTSYNVGARRAASSTDLEASPRILQSFGTPQPPAPRKTTDMRPPSDDPFL